MAKMAAAKKNVKSVKKAVKQKRASTIKSTETELKNRIARLEKRLSLVKTDCRKELSKAKKALHLERMQLKKKYDKEFSEVKNKLRAVKVNARTITNISNNVSELSKKLYSRPQKTTMMVDESRGQTAGQGRIAPLTISEEELAADIVSLYFEEIARHGFKRTLTLDDIIKTFSYTLKEIKKELSFLRPKIKTVAEADTVQTIVEEPEQQIKGFSFTNSRGQKYFLHQRGKLFYFSKKEEGSNPLPRGMTVIENERTGLPMVKKI